jgi:hypothetical protein
MFTPADLIIDYAPRGINYSFSQIRAVVLLGTARAFAARRYEGRYLPSDRHSTMFAHPFRIGVFDHHGYSAARVSSQDKGQTASRLSA